MWPKKSIMWTSEKILHISIPFTWELPRIKAILKQKSFFWNSVIVGGPAAYLMPDYFSELPYVVVKKEMHGVLQRINPMATRTTTGCVRNCGFCGVKKFEGKFQELSDWPDLPIICDNNILASSQQHFDRVLDRLEKYEIVDFNQGLDARLLTEYHAERFARIRPILRLSFDNMDYADSWENAFSILRKKKIPLSYIRSYVLIGYNSGPDESWKRAEWVENHKIKALPMWFHGLNQLEKNIVTENQKLLGWNDFERKRIMGFFYKHRGERRC